MKQFIFNNLLYGGITKTDYCNIKEDIEKSNRTIAFLFSVVAFILIAIMETVSHFTPSLMSSRPVYRFGIIFSGIQIIISIISKKYSKLTYVSVYMAISVFLIYGILIGAITRADQQTVTFMVLLIFVPLIFLDRPIRMAAFLSAYVLAFILIAKQTKPADIYSVDMIDAMIFGMLSIVTETIIYRTKIKALDLEKRLHIMSETDQLTGLNNRNCYEFKLSTYPSRYKSSITCIYIDVNGLHDLNNTKGHAAGDQMLIFVADMVKNQFGQENTFRIGGDEYVAFALDLGLTDIEARIKEIEERLKEEKYHAAIGFDRFTEKNVNISELIMKAESVMYKNKADYYKEKNIPMRSAKNH